MSQISMLSSGDRSGWAPLADPPGRIPSHGREIETDDGRALTHVEKCWAVHHE